MTRRASSGASVSLATHYTFSYVAGHLKRPTLASIGRGSSLKQPRHIIAQRQMKEGSCEPKQTRPIHRRKKTIVEEGEVSTSCSGHFSAAGGRVSGMSGGAREWMQERRRRRSADVSQVCAPSSLLVKSRGSLTPRPSVTMEITSCQDGWRITGATEGRSLCGNTAGANHNACEGVRQEGGWGGGQGG